MEISQKGLDLIISSEGIILEAYKDPGLGWDLPTIGIGTTIYPNGNKVKKGDIITKEQAIEYLKHDTLKFSKGVSSYVTSKINQNQFDALVSFSYNLGLGNLKSSTLLKKVNINPNDISIKDEFKKWVRSGGKILNGLITRRNKESELYFSKT